MPRPLITLTTDFGLSDHYVGTMKGAILRICPNAEIVDICHLVSPFEISEGAFVIAQAYRFFPKKTAHVVVIDPGVGTSRRPILAQAAEQFFIAPDNGVLSMIYSREKHKVRAVTSEKYFLKPASRTFHGRDIFAPVAAYVAKGVAPGRMGKPIQDYLRSDFENPRRTGKRFWSGAILKIDHFGNLITNFRLAEFPELEQRPFELEVGAKKIARLARNYAECGPGELCIIDGSSGFLEISSNQASAAKMLGCGVGAPVELTIW